ncbi:dolichyl pyrophosphate protein [Anaeramoeba flamelloides]|uniref:Alpha-1,3-glucosyltransferase n=1 Tax=Anaeramoeba flamelloides TaxID=1746091 RepID=A0ABQ8ZAD2_9EUKA|nr:dolichyl pyrophosphate protein [Anaeramoeba flamelloides]
MIEKLKSPKRYLGIIISILVGVTLRICLGTNPYSGESSPPLYGDYEAQRHWMEITSNLPVSEWYQNSTSNDLLYWGLDYPPLTAYHSYLMGKIFSIVDDGDFMRLYTSRGYETEFTKMVMRMSVIVSDLLLLFPSLYLVTKIDFTHSTERDNFQEGVNQKKKGKGKEKEQEKEKEKKKVNNNKQKNILIWNLMLLQPALLLIDHVHFQYNSIGLSMIIFAYYLACQDKWSISLICFYLGCFYKQMNLYYAIPFAIYYLTQLIKKKKYRVLFLGFPFISICCLSITFLPWLLTSVDSLKQVIHRIFPFERLIYEDKLANFWCLISPIIDFRNDYSIHITKLFSLGATLFFAMPSNYNLARYGGQRRFKFALLNTSLAFFLFSFQVHEKSILIPAMIATLFIQDKELSIYSFWFILTSAFSLFPLIQREHSELAYISAVGIFVTAYWLIAWNQIKITYLTKKLLLVNSLIIIFAHGLIYIQITPSYPDIGELIFHSIIGLNFGMAYIFFSYKQFTIPSNFTKKKFGSQNTDNFKKLK